MKKIISKEEYDKLPIWRKYRFNKKKVKENIQDILTFIVIGATLGYILLGWWMMYLLITG